MKKKIISKLVSKILKSKTHFVKEAVFRAHKTIDELMYTSNSYGEKYMVHTYDDYISKSIYKFGDFELNKLIETINYLNKSKNITTIYDIGANIGSICIPALKRGYVQKAYAVEPVLKNYKLLKINVLLNNLSHSIKCYNTALSSKDDEIVKMEISPNNLGDCRVKLGKSTLNNDNEDSREINEVKTKKFDTLFKNINAETDLIWMDTQGYEAVILEGAEELIKSKASIVIEFWPYNLKRNGLWDKLKLMFEKFKFYVNLSEKDFILLKCNKENINALFYKSEQENKNNYEFLLDILFIN